jgi:uncharacterized membrane protein YdjX (TVP38/TMEM64 family)
MNKNKLLHLLGFILVIAAVYVLVNVTGLRHNILHFHQWIDGFGYWAPTVFFVIYIIATVFMAPISVLTITAGVILGSLVGIVVASVGSALGGGICFLISRYIARDYIKKHLERSHHLNNLDEMTNKYGAYIVAGSRIALIFPCAFLNYGFGLTKVNFSTFLLWTWLGMIPEISAYVLGTNIVYKMILHHKINWMHISVLVLALACVIAVTVRAKKYLSEKKIISDAEMDNDCE